MRKLFIMLIPILLIVACQSDNEPPEKEVDDRSKAEQSASDNNVDEGSEETTDESGETEGGADEELDHAEYMDTKMEALNFYEFELDVEYMDGKEYELDIEKDDNRPYEAKIEDELNDVYLQGREAFDEIFPKIEQLQISNDSEQVDVVEQVLNIFDLPDNYKKFEIEVTFNDGSELDFEIKR